ncbi:fumarylacetoacetate hydrolase family protein [Parapedobacter lycopersici]|uniref:fumarylacetoacetate hydrolase family protein n=1 Tax=Parapedobacter lycopersici TaxID=1864939 RepID=UPI00214DA66D|nr:fumarylacetoacetate hydrolase family protein [Parapedobacter lycopersici]
MKLYKIKDGILIAHDGGYYRIERANWDSLVNRNHLFDYLSGHLEKFQRLEEDHAANLLQGKLLPPIARQEVWASGVTYFRSREARIEESQGGGYFYDRVYEAERPELFFKATAQRTVGANGVVRIRKDSSWDVPEPELTLFINKQGLIQGYTIGNDMSSRAIEAENPLYLPQAKVYEGCAGLGPCLYVSKTPLAADTKIELEILRDGTRIFTNTVGIDKMKRSQEELASFLFRECAFPYGCYLMTGTGIVPPDEFTLQSNDEIRITIEPIGTLVNYVA